MTESATVECVRCRRQAPALARAPVPGPTGTEVQGKVCADCWREWEQAEVMVINEFRLNFMDPRAQEILDQQMREFLALDAGSGGSGKLPVS